MTELETTWASLPQQRRIFCNRTLNMRAIRAIGYDMDYTLIQYRMEEWEQRAYEHVRNRLAEQGWPVQKLQLDPTLALRGLVIDTMLGNVLKANRFGYVKKAYHGTRLLDFEEQRTTYARTMVDLADSRYVFLNTFFSISEACLYAQLVDLLDERRLPEVLGYADLYRRVRSSLDAAHMEGKLKAEITANPERFVELEPDAALALLDQQNAGKKLLLITNSDSRYTASMMSYAFDRFLPGGRTWRDLFEFVITAARKPAFFTDKNPLFEVVTEDGLLRPGVAGLEPGKVYWGGNAHQVERALGLSGDQLLYVGDHLFGDVQVTKSILRWRTALVLRELEEELSAVEAARGEQAELDRLMREKEELELRYWQLRLARQRRQHGYGPSASTDRELPGAAGQAPASGEPLVQQMDRLRIALMALDEKISPRAQAAGGIYNNRWGMPMRAGNDKSLLAREMESYADIYMSRVANFLYQTPFFYLRSPRGSMPHDPGPTGMEEYEG